MLLTKYKHLRHKVDIIKWVSHFMILTQVLLFASISIIKWAMLKGTPLPAERRSDRPRSLLRTLAPLQLLGRARRPPSRRLMRPCLPLQARRWRRSPLRASRACARGQPHSSLSANGPNRPCSTTPGCPSPCCYEFFCDTFPSTLVPLRLQRDYRKT